MEASLAHLHIDARSPDNEEISLEDSGLHEASAAEGCAAQAQRVGRRGFAKTFPTKSMSRTLMRSKRRCGKKKNTAAKWWSITAGPARAQQVLARGAGQRRGPGDSSRRRRVRRAWTRSILREPFAAAIKDENFDLIFTGLQSDDYGYAQTGVVLAELLGLAARDHHYADRKKRCWNPREARTRSWATFSSSTCRCRRC